jgi:ATP-dependent RNA helicase SUPV3L1/SUV3
VNQVANLATGDTPVGEAGAIAPAAGVDTKSGTNGDASAEGKTGTERHHRRRRHGAPGEVRRDEAGARGPRPPEERRAEPPGERPRGERPRGERGDRPRFGKDRNKDRNEQKGWREHLPRRERDKEPDPDSPFAKLAALKAQLEANAKERR